MKKFGFILMAMLSVFVFSCDNSNDVDDPTDEIVDLSKETFPDDLVYEDRSPGNELFDTVDPPIVGDSNKDRDFCKGGRNDDYIHMERFYDQYGKLICLPNPVIFDHQINEKWNRTIKPYIFNETGVQIDDNNIDFTITLIETGESITFHDVFNWKDVYGNDIAFNTNQLVYDNWYKTLKNVKSSYTFGVKMTHIPTNTDISIIFKDHDNMTVYLKGLKYTNSLSKLPKNSYTIS